MSHKIVNLDDARNSITITIGEKDFTINRIVHKSMQLYGEYLIFVAKYIEILRKSSVLTEQKDAGKDEVKKALEEIEESLLEYGEEKLDKLLSMLQILLEKNGYEYSQEWWLENSQVSEIETFITEAMKKDEAESKKKI